MLGLDYIKFESTKLLCITIKGPNWYIHEKSKTKLLQTKVYGLKLLVIVANLTIKFKLIKYIAQF